MRLFVAGLAVLLLAACTPMSQQAPVAAYVAQAPAGSPVARHGALQVVGGRVVDAHGQPVTLRGMSLFWSQWAPQYYSRETVGWLASDWHVTVVRAAIAAEGTDSAVQHMDRELAKAATVIEAAAGNGIYVIVDWHQHHQHPDEAERFMTAIARRYGHLPNLIYEPYNEPLRDGVDWSRDVKPYHQRLVGAIRRIDPDNLIVLGSPSWSQDVDIAARDPVAGTNLVYTLHYYAATHKAELRAKADAALAAGLALMVTEYGVVEATGNGPVDIASSREWWDWAEANGVSYLAWSIGDRNETSAALQPGALAWGWGDGQLTPAGRLMRAHLRAAAEVESRAQDD
ncbi:MAG: glycoside hydrolase family 5 protein [Alteraurantiacibacter sp.]